MATLSFATEELKAVRHALTAYLSDLRTEIHATDSFEMREGLKREEELLNRALAEIEPHLPPEEPAP